MSKNSEVNNNILLNVKLDLSDNDCDNISDSSEDEKIVKIVKDNDKKKSNGDVKAKKVFALKDAKFKKEQDELFTEVKKIIDLSPINIFLSKTVSDNNEKITGEIFTKIKQYHHSKMWNRIKGNDTQSSMAILRKLFKHHGFEVLTKEYKVGDDRGYKYYVIPLGV